MEALIALEELKEHDLIAGFLASRRSEATRTAYRSDLCDFVRFLGSGGRGCSLIHFLSLPAERIREDAQAYKQDMVARGASTATVNRRLAGIRTLLNYASQNGAATVDGRSLVHNQRNYSQQLPPGLKGMQMRCLLSLPDLDSIRGRRDAAILRLLCENMLRVSEICSATIGDFSASAGSLTLGNAPAPRTANLSARCVRTLADYLEADACFASAEWPLFRNLDHRPGYRYSGLTAKGLRYILTNYGVQIGIDLTPTLLRRSSVALAASTLEVTSSAVLSALDQPDQPESVSRRQAVDRAALTQTRISQILSDLLSDPAIIRADAERIRERSITLRDKSSSITARSDRLLRISRALLMRMEEQAQRWANHEARIRDNAEEG